MSFRLKLIFEMVFKIEEKFNTFDEPVPAGQAESEQVSLTTRLSRDQWKK